MHKLTQNLKSLTIKPAATSSSGRRSRSRRKSYGLFNCAGGERSRSCTPERNATISCRLPADLPHPLQVPAAWTTALSRTGSMDSGVDVKSTLESTKYYYTGRFNTLTSNTVAANMDQDGIYEEIPYFDSNVSKFEKSRFDKRNKTSKIKTCPDVAPTSESQWSSVFHKRATSFREPRKSEPGKVQGSGFQFRNLSFRNRKGEKLRSRDHRVPSMGVQVRNMEDNALYSRIPAAIDKHSQSEAVSYERYEGSMETQQGLYKNESVMLDKEQFSIDNACRQRNYARPTSELQLRNYQLSEETVKPVLMARQKVVNERPYVTQPAMCPKTKTRACFDPELPAYSRQRAGTFDENTLRNLSSPAPSPPPRPPPPIPSRNRLASFSGSTSTCSRYTGCDTLFPRPTDAGVCLVRTLCFDRFMTNKWISGLAVTSKNQLVVVDLREAYLFDGEGNYKRTIGNKGAHRLVEPIDLCVLSNDQLAFSDHSDQDVKIYTSKGQFVITISDATLTNIAGIASNIRDEIFVAGTDKKCVSVHSDDDQLLYTLPAPDRGIKSLFDHPYSVAVNQLTGDVIVGDDYRQVITAVSTEDCRLQWRFCPSGGRERHFFPSSICVDKDGYVFVADLYNEKVYMLDSSGRFLRTLLSRDNGLTGGPGAIAVDRQGQIYVADEEKTVKVFRYVDEGTDGFSIYRRTNFVPDAILE